MSTYFDTLGPGCKERELRATATSTRLPAETPSVLGMWQAFLALMVCQCHSDDEVFVMQMEIALRVLLAKPAQAAAELVLIVIEPVTVAPSILLYSHAPPRTRALPGCP